MLNSVRPACKTDEWTQDLSGPQLQLQLVASAQVSHASLEAAAKCVMTLPHRVNSMHTFTASIVNGRSLGRSSFISPKRARGQHT